MYGLLSNDKFYKVLILTNSYIVKPEGEATKVN